MKYVAILLLLSSCSQPIFSMKYRCNGVPGKISHELPHIHNCQLKMYAVNFELNKSCHRLTIEESYCGNANKGH